MTNGSLMNVESIAECSHWPALRVTLQQQGISETILYGELVYKFKRIVEKPYFSDQLKYYQTSYKGCI